MEDVEKNRENLLPRAPFSRYTDYCASLNGSPLQPLTLQTDRVLEEISASGLRGRGGAGFPTGVKWQSIFHHPCLIRDVVCNAAEGEPGTFKDRYLLRYNPYACLEGLAIAAQVINARAIYIGIKASFTQELARLLGAIEEMTAAKVFGAIPVKIIEGPEEYLFGEEKALLRFIEEGSPLPREAQYPPYEKGLFADARSPNPALVNNVETFAHVPYIVRFGAGAFRQRGTADTPGTVLFTVSGDVKRPGVYECDAGITLRNLIEDKAGGASQAPIKAILSGVSNAVITSDKLDTPCDFGSLAMMGSGLGSAGIVVYNQTRSMPRLAQAVARFLYVESCNQCTACKYGLHTASKAIDDLFDPMLATSDDLERALYAARSAPQGNRCYLPVQGSVLIPSLLERFHRDFEEQILHPHRQVAEIALPIFKDFDEKSNTFRIVENYHLKNPDWTYRKEAKTPSVKQSESRGSIGVRLAPDVFAQLQTHKDFDPGKIDRLVNDLLRESIKRT